MSIISKRIGEIFIALLCDANIQELDDQHLRELGLIRADFGSSQWADHAVSFAVQT